MKKLLIVGIALAIPALGQARSYGMAGCGLGSLAFGNDKGMVQILAATTNGTFYSQTFGITSGTSNCSDSQQLANLDQENFIQVNYANVVKDAASGGGEYLATFATLLGCEAQSHDAFFSMVQTEHRALFDEQTASKVLSNVKSAAKRSDSLRQRCARI